MATTKNKQAPEKAITMADLLAKSKSSIKSLSLGQRVKGTVIQKLTKSLILDIKGKAEGIVTEKAFAEAREYISKLKVGDEVIATVLVPEMRDGSTLLSLREAILSSAWANIEKSYTDKTPVVCLVKSVSQSGLMADVNGITGFIPMSQVSKESSKNPDNLVNKYFKVKIIEVDRNRNKLMLSEKEITDAADIALVKKALSEVKPGEVIDGVVTTVSNFGIFVKVKINKIFVEGLVHISEISWGKTNHPGDIYKIGDKVKIAVLGVRDNKLALSVKQTIKDPWLEVDKKYKAEDRLTCKVTKLTDFGIFAELEPGVEGLIHITKIAPGKKFSVGDEVKVYIEEIDTKSRKISLGLVLTSIPIGYK